MATNVKLPIGDEEEGRLLPGIPSYSDVQVMQAVSGVVRLDVSLTTAVGGGGGNCTEAESQQTSSMTTCWTALGSYRIPFIHILVTSFPITSLEYTCRADCMDTKLTLILLWRLQDNGSEMLKIRKLETVDLGRDQHSVRSLSSPQGIRLEMYYCTRFTQTRGGPWWFCFLHQSFSLFVMSGPHGVYLICVSLLYPFSTSDHLYLLHIFLVDWWSCFDMYFLIFSCSIVYRSRHFISGCGCCISVGFFLPFD